jgi:hypothetical protein
MQNQKSNHLLSPQEEDEQGKHRRLFLFLLLVNGFPNAVTFLANLIPTIAVPKRIHNWV